MDENEETKEVAPDKHTIVHEFKSDADSVPVEVERSVLMEIRLVKGASPRRNREFSRSMILPMWALTTEHR